MTPARTIEDELREQLTYERARSDRMEKRLDKIIASITREPKPIVVKKARAPEDVEGNARRRAEVSAVDRHKKASPGRQRTWSTTSTSIRSPPGKRLSGCIAKRPTCTPPADDPDEACPSLRSLRRAIASRPGRRPLSLRRLPEAQGRVDCRAGSRRRLPRPPRSRAVTVDPRRPLTNMQHVVAECFGRFGGYGPTAKELGISRSTVRVHVHAIASLLPNPDGLPPSKVVFLWAAQRRWESAQTATSRKAT
jgi:hypothetical protein